MRKHLPNLPAPYVFKATAQQLSFSRAAVELNLTQGAISQHPHDPKDRVDEAAVVASAAPGGRRLI